MATCPGRSSQARPRRSTAGERDRDDSLPISRHAYVVRTPIKKVVVVDANRVACSRDQVHDGEIWCRAEGDEQRVAAQGHVDPAWQPHEPERRLKRGG